MKFDIIIANPPYGKIGAEITKAIIDNVEFDEYVNLMPANDYRRHIKGLYNYASDMVPVHNGFKDATVTTQIAKIHKSPVNNMTDDEFEISTYIDPQLDKYFKENNKRKMTTQFDTSSLSASKIYDINKTFIIGWRDPAHKHMPYKKTTTSYKWNIDETIDFNYIISNHLNKSNNSVPFGGLIFKSSIEKKNYSKFVYSENGFRFISKIFTAMQSDVLKNLSTYFTKVDWSRPWTVEEILADYGYTPDEIQAVMDDLNRFKYMDL